MLSANVLCLKKRKKRTYSLSDAADKRSASSEPRSNGGAVTMLQITEDTPPDMLAGAMDLTVHLPTGRAVKMAVERSTPMMDLLVQITTTHQLQLSNYTLQALGMAPSSEHSDKILPYKPNTAIGTLDTQHIKVIPKSRSLPVPKNVPPGHQPFESTFRLKVHLPRNQLYVTRVSRNVQLEDIMRKVCEEKNLDPMKYDFKHPGNLDEVLDPKLTLSDYQITEIYVVLKGTVSLTQAFSTSDIMALRKEEERKQMHNKTGGGVFNLIFRRGKSSMGSGSVSSDTRSISPTHSDDSRSVTPPAVQQQIITPPKKDPPAERPKPPQRKRRPAPKPPQQSENSRRNSVDKPASNISENVNEVSELQSKKVENGLTICHSRNSSDSSGYHEASVLSENCNTSLPRRPKSVFVTGGDAEKISKQHSHSTTNLSKMSSHSKSTASLAIAGRKKKAAPPPPPVIRASTPTLNLEAPSPVVASQPAVTLKESVKSANISRPTLDSLASITSSQSNNLNESNKSEEKSFESTDSGIAPENIEKLSEPDVPSPPPPVFEEAQITQPTPPPVVEDIKVPETVPSPPSNGTSENWERLEPEVVKEPQIEEVDWQYQLPSPPKAFRDCSPGNFADSVNSECHSVTDFKDSVVTSPELFEKLKAIEDNQSEKETVSSDINSVVSEEEKPLLNTLSLEHLEKRKSLVYNRELATSLKMTDILDATDKAETFSSSLTKFESTYNEIRKSSLPKETAEPKYIQKSHVSSHTLPNFKISTYDRPKQIIKVFEDDTIRSNTDYYHKLNTVLETNSSNLNKSYTGRSMENISFNRNSFDSQSSHSNEEKGYKFAKPENPTSYRSFGPNSSVFRSESFSHDNAWTPSKTISRSKSHLTLNANKYKEENLEVKTEESISRSNSLYDVSGLQSLGVMKLIQNKLNSTTSSTENLGQKEKYQNSFSKTESKKETAPTTPTVEESQKPKAPEKVYKYRGPPSVNMGTWLERPKVPVSVKEDADYKLSNNVSSKLIVNTTNNNVTSNNSIEIKTTKPNSIAPPINTTNVRVNGYDQKEPNSVSIKVNGTESVGGTQGTGNVIIKIGSVESQNAKLIDNQRFISHTTAAGYRKPFSSVNKIQPVQRPHSVAFDSDFDISRVPVVKSFELKKPFKDMSNNTSVTQINQEENGFKSHTLNRTEPVSELKNKFSNMYRSTETLCNNAYLSQNGHKEPETEVKPALRVHSFKPNIAPVVRGFQLPPSDIKINNRLSWNSNSYNTLPVRPKEKDSFTTNKHVPFSQMSLKRTESNKVFERNLYNTGKPESPVDVINEKNSAYNSLPSITKPDIIKPPPPPQLPTVNLMKTTSKPLEPVQNPRDQLLSAIRNFGGKKGLKSVKA